MTSRLVLKIAVDDRNSERLQTALSVASAAVASDVPTEVWLAGESVWLAVSDSPPDELLAGILAGATIRVCARCAAQRGLTDDHLRSGAAIGGAAEFVAAITAPDVQALVY